MSVSLVWPATVFHSSHRSLSTPLNKFQSVCIRGPSKNVWDLSTICISSSVGEGAHWGLALYVAMYPSPPCIMDSLFVHIQLIFFILQSTTFISRMALDGLHYIPHLLHVLTFLLSVYLISVAPRHSHIWLSFDVLYLLYSICSSSSHLLELSVRVCCRCCLT